MSERDNFFVVLPSNSSMTFFPDNTTTHFITQLPTALKLDGLWALSLAEIHVPMTFLHVPTEYERNFVYLKINKNPDNKPIITESMAESTYNNEEIIAAYGGRSDSVQHGIYNTVHDVLQLINNFWFLKYHLKFELSVGGYTIVTLICDKNCAQHSHILRMGSAINKILGITDDIVLSTIEGKTYTGSRPAALSNSIPNSLFVYTDICESYITGDVQAPLLRVVPVESNNYCYGSVKIKSFSSSRYIPILRRGFQTIEIDIRDEFGKPIPFEYGTLTVTLQFKRIN